MSMQSQEFPGGQPFSGTSSRQTSASPHPGQRQAEICPGCRAPVADGDHVCQTCGTILHSQPQQRIRCRHCRQEASAAYAICPHCGRALAAAPSLAFTLALPAATLLLLVLILLGRMAWAEQDQAADVVAVENPVLMTPVRGDSITSSAPTGGGEPPAAEEAAPAVSADGDVPPLPAFTHTPTTTPPTETAPTDTPESSPTPTPSSLPTETATATPTSSVTSSVTPTSTITPTVAAPAIATSALAARIYTVQDGDTVLSIATRFQITVVNLLNANQLSPLQALKLQPGASLTIPGSGALVETQPGATASTSPTSTPTATPTQTATLSPATATSTATVAVRATAPGEQIYTLQEGDTLVGIALRFNTSTEMLMSINGLTIAQARFLLAGQQIIVPIPGQPLPPTATPGLRRYVVQSGDTIIGIAADNGISTNLLLTVNGMTAALAPALRAGDELLIPAPGYVLPTATPRPTAIPTALQSPTPTPTNTIRLDAPSQLDPAQDTNVSCGAANQIIRWNPVNGLAPGDEYMLSLSYVNSTADTAGNVQVVPLFEQRTGQTTNWQMNPSYCNLAPQTFGRRWRWYVQVFNGDVPVSPPSPVWEFTWR